MQLLNSWWKSLEPIFAYVSYCFSEPMQAPVCRPFWTWVMIGALSIGALMLLVLTWKFVSYKLKLAAAWRAQEQRDRIPDEATFKKVSWEGDKAYSGELGGEEIERRIRAAVNQRRLENLAKQVKLNIV